MKDTIICVLVLIIVVITGLWFFSERAEAPVETEPVVIEPLPDQPGPANLPPEVVDGDYIGLTVTQAVAKAEAADELFRVVEIDGEPQAVTEDFRPGRINAVVMDDIVIRYEIEGAVMGLGDEETLPPNKPAGEHDNIIGMTEAEASAYAADSGVPFRIGSIDGEFMALTMDYRPGRITASLEGGVVVDYTVE